MGRDGGKGHLTIGPRPPKHNRAALGQPADSRLADGSAALLQNVQQVITDFLFPISGMAVAPVLVGSV